MRIFKRGCPAELSRALLNESYKTLEDLHRYCGHRGCGVVICPACAGGRRKNPVGPFAELLYCAQHAQEAE